MIARIFALCARERLFTAMNQFVCFQVAGLSSRIVALVAVVFLFQISSILDVEIFCQLNSLIFHDLVMSSQYRDKV